MLKKLLKKFNVGSYEELNEEEKKTYLSWEESLVGRKLTDEDVASFLSGELDLAVSRITDIGLSKEDELFRKMEIRFIKKIQNFLNSPKVEKQFAQKAIEQML